MKHLIYLTILLGCSITALAQVPGSGHNSVLESTVRRAGYKNSSALVNLPVDSVNRSIQYFDGLGRLIQQTSVKGSPGGNDLIQPIAYDGFGRVSMKYEPYTAVSNGGAYRVVALAAQGSFYSSPPPGVLTNAAPYAKTVFEPSPLNRVLEQGAPGLAWQPAAAHTIRMAYAGNVFSDSVRLWTMNGTDNGATSSLFAAGKVFKTISKDENWSTGKSGTTEEYKDLDGRVLLKKVWQSELSALKTQYIYDDYGNLRYVLPPAVSVTSFSEADAVYAQFIYGYRYDGRGRLIEKKVPGKGRELMVYNPLDQLVLTQDSVQRVKSTPEWTFTKYDAFGKVISTGIYSSSSSQATLQATVNGFANFWETRASGSDYSNTAFPTSSTDTYTINYYDNYSFPGNSFGSPSGSGQVDYPLTKGLLTGNKVKTLGSSTMLLSVSYYDKEARPIQHKSQNHLNGTDVLTQTYSFVGELLSSIRSHVANSVTTTIGTYADYDHVGRKVATRSVINSQPEVMLSRLFYNELGQLKDQKLHSKDNGTSFLYTSGYSYNERGWLKQMSGTEFSFELKYNDATGGMTAQYNGNIAGQVYNNNGSNTFNYAYDKLNRLTSGAASGMTEVLSYDVMGNIKHLNRNSGGTALYSYSGNRLNSISGGGLTTGAYGYDGNGNATTDGRTGVTLTYNYLNLPATAIKSGLNLTYTYDAAGNKLRKLNSTTATTTDYVAGIQYTGGVIDFIQTENGIAKDTLGVYRYRYNLTDHLGNVRATIRESVATPGSLQVMQRDNYYAFGLTQVAGARNNKYLYNSKELQSELGQYDYGARFYDPVIGRWNVIDGLAENHFSVTTYNYVLNNPINIIDPLGLDTTHVNDLNEVWKNFDTDNDEVELNTVEVTATRGEAKAKRAYNEILATVQESYKRNVGWRFQGYPDNLQNIAAEKFFNKYIRYNEINPFTGQTRVIGLEDANWIVDLATGGIISLVRTSSALAAARGGTIVFRAVDATEGAIIKSTSKFSLQKGGLEAKYFAKSIQDAHWYGQRLYPNGYSIIQGTVKNPVNASQYWFPHIDIGAYVFPKEILPYIKPH